MYVQPSQADGEPIAALIAALDSTDWNTRDEAMEALIAIGTKAHTALQKVIDAGIMPSAVCAARVLYQQREPQIFQLMQRLIVSENPLLGQLAVDYVVRYSRHDAVNILLTCLPSCPYLVQISIVTMLGALHATDAVDALINLLDVSYGSTLRMTVVSALGRIGDKSALTVVRGLIEDSDPHVSRMSRRAAAMIEGGVSVELSYAQLGHCDCLI
jgi:HEAT repeat protein